MRSRLPNSFDPEIRSTELIKRRIIKHDARIKNKNKTNKIRYQIGQRVRLQNISTRDWELKGTIDRVRTADDGRVVSYDVLTDRNHMTTRHRRYLKPLHEDHDPKANKDDVDNVDTANYAIENADLPEKIVESVAPRRSNRSSRRISSLEAAKVIRIMGGDQSKPINATIELKIEAGEDKVRIEAGEVRYMGTRKALTNQGTGKDQITRQNVRSSNNPRDGKDARSGSLNVTRYGSSSQQLFTQGYGRMHKANTGQGRQGGSLGSLHMAQGSGTQGAGGPMRRRQAAGISGVRNRAVEIITLTDSEDEELDELEARLLRMVEKRNGRKRSHPETRASIMPSDSAVLNKIHGQQIGYSDHSA